MKLSTLFSTFAQHQKGAELSGNLRSGPMSGPIERSRADARPLGGDSLQDHDQLNLSREAAFAMAASRFDPRNMSEQDAHHLAEMLFDHDAISPREYEILSSGPGRRGGVFRCRCWFVRARAVWERHQWGRMTGAEQVNERVEAADLPDLARLLAAGDAPDADLSRAVIEPRRDVTATNAP